MSDAGEIGDFIFRVWGRLTKKSQYKNLAAHFLHNDGVLDAAERKKLEDVAMQYGIHPTKCAELVAEVRADPSFKARLAALSEECASDVNSVGKDRALSGGSVEPPSPPQLSANASAVSGARPQPTSEVGTQPNLEPTHSASDLAHWVTEVIDAHGAHLLRAKLGVKLLADDASAQMINQLLDEMGLQRKIDKLWTATQAGASHSVTSIVTNSRGGQISRLRWRSSVKGKLLAEIRRRISNRTDQPSPTEEFVSELGGGNSLKSVNDDKTVAAGQDDLLSASYFDVVTKATATQALADNKMQNHIAAFLCTDPREVAKKLNGVHGKTLVRTAFPEVMDDDRVKSATVRVAIDVGLASRISLRTGLDIGQVVAALAKAHGRTKVKKLFPNWP